MRKQILVLLASVVSVTAAIGQEADELPNDAEPILRVDTGGPSSFVSTLAFGRDGRTLYAGGWDKVVRCWSLDKEGRFVPAPAGAFRVPLGPGDQGSINALAVSTDGNWLAIAGKGPTGRAGFRSLGRVFQGGMTPKMRLNEGAIYLYDLRTRAVRTLRGHKGAVKALAFVSDPDAPQLLVSAGDEDAVLASDGDEDTQHKEFVGKVMLWNVEHPESPIAQTTLSRPPPRPNLAVLRGSKPDAARVVIAWQDGKLRAWDTQQENPHAIENASNNKTVDLLGDQSTVVTSVFRTSKGTGSLEFWDVAEDASLSRADRDPIIFRPSERSLSCPWATTLVASRPGSKLDHIAVATLEFELNGRKPKPKRMRLSVISTEDGRTAKTDLWPVTSFPPRQLTLAGGGGHLAVGGAPNHEIRVYSIQDLLNKRNNPHILRSAANAMADVAFAKKGQKLGLMLNEQKGGDFNLVLPLQGGKLESYRRENGWRQADANSDWSAEFDAGDGRTIKVANKGRLANEFAWLPKDEDPGRRRPILRVSPSMPPHEVPIVVLATDVRGQPFLQLYNGKTGEQLREYTGHTLFISALAFSPDFRLLASTSQDQTVRVWSLTDLDMIVGKHGALAGVVVDKTLRVTRISPKSHERVQENVKENDRLVGYVSDDGKRHEWKTHLDFYRTWWTLKPGSELSVLLERNNTEKRIALPVGQGIDERKPLFSLMVTRESGIPDPQWIGWSPLGPFEASGRRVERYLGWHFDTGDPENPIAYAQLDQYRRQYHRPGLLADLVVHGSLRPPRKPEPLRAPAMSLLLQLDNKHMTGDSPFRVDAKPQQASVSLAVDSAFPTEVVKQVDLRIDEEIVGKFQLAADGTWNADLPIEIWKRGPLTVASVLTTRESPPQAFVQQLEVRFVPAAPQIVSLPPSTSNTSDTTTNIEAEVKAGLAGDPFTIELCRIRGEARDVLRRWKSEKSVKIDEKRISLDVGSNTFELIAKNFDATTETAEDETAARRFVITRFKGQVKPPRIQLSHLVTKDGQSQSGENIPIHVGQHAVVRSPSVRVVGSVKAEDNNLELVGKLVRGAVMQLEKFQPNRHERFVIDDDVELVPGPQEVLYGARVKDQDSKSAMFRLLIDYQPRLPVLNIVFPPDGHKLEEYSENPVVELEASLDLPADRQAFGAQVLVNGKAIAEQPTIDEKQNTLRSAVPLRFGDNEIKVRVFNKWNVETVNSVRIAYRPGPRIDTIEAPKQVETPFLNLKVAAMSESEISQVDVDELPLKPESYRVEPDEKNEKRFTIVIDKLPFNPAREKLSLRLFAKEASATAAVEVKLPQIIRKPPETAAIEVIDPQNDISVTNPQYAVQFAVRSTSRLRKVELWRKVEAWRQRETVFSADGADLPDDGAAFRKEVAVQLEPGVNYFYVTAENDGGVIEEMLKLSYTVPPVMLTIDSLAPVIDGKPGQPIDSNSDNAGNVIFAKPADSYRLLLTGRVRWNPGAENQPASLQSVNVWVNGFHQLPAALNPSDGRRERPFSVEIVLNRKEDNLIEVDLPGLARTASSRRRLFVDCDALLPKQRLHLLVLGGSAKEKESLAAAWKAAFDSVRPYGPIGGPVVEKGKILTALKMINLDIQARVRNKDATNNVVMVYYQGGEFVQEDQRILLTTEQIEDPGLEVLIRNRARLNALSMDNRFLTENVEKQCGAHVLLFDVSRRTSDGTSVVQIAPNEPRLAVLSYAWLTKSPATVNAPRLVGAIERAYPRSERLRELADQLGQASVQQASKDILSYDRYVPTELQDLELRQGSP